METMLKRPIGKIGKGKRPRQEDCIMPSPEYVAENETCFVICDGMGGHGYGDVASKVVAESVYYSLKLPIQASGEKKILSSVDNAYHTLDAHSTTDGSKDMGTTLACVYINDEGYYAAHIGDSRIYHFRPSFVKENLQDGILYRSWDHSLVNMLVKLGDITDEEAKYRNDRNILLKAMQPCKVEERWTPFIYESSDINPGDYLFICSDGVHGEMDENVFLEILANSLMSDEEKASKIEEYCERYGKDNFSFWLIPIVEQE